MLTAGLLDAESHSSEDFMKKWVYPVTLVALLALLISVTACNIGGGNTTTSRQEAVRRGDISVTVNGSGNIELLHEMRLTFGVGGKISRIYVNEGDTVKKGDLLATLDTDDIALAAAQAENSRMLAEQAVTQAKLALSQMETAKVQAEGARVQAEVALEAAKFDLDRMKQVQDIKDKIEEAQNEQQVAEINYRSAIQANAEEADLRAWAGLIASAKAKELENQQKLVDLLKKDEFATLQVTEVKLKQLQVDYAQQSLSQSVKAIDQAGLNIEQAKRNITYAQTSYEFAAKNAEYSRKQLDKARLSAPMDGLVVTISADEGDTVPSPTLATKTVFYLIDTSALELKVDVDEIDLPGVKLGQKAVISIDALPDLKIEGKVTYISPVPTPATGVVLYRTTIAFQPPPNSPLRAGMSASADIVLKERENVLLVPERAVTEKDGKPVVKVIAANGQSQDKEVVTGITDGFDIEIVSGLSEGETVVVETKAATSQGLFGQ
jgi:RND family efflux transporter MFP subunit